MRIYISIKTRRSASRETECAMNMAEAHIRAPKPEIGRRWNCGVISSRRLQLARLHHDARGAAAFTYCDASRVKSLVFHSINIILFERHCINALILRDGLSHGNFYNSTGCWIRDDGNSYCVMSDGLSLQAYVVEIYGCWPMGLPKLLAVL